MTVMNIGASQPHCSVIIRWWALLRFMASVVVALYF